MRKELNSDSLVSVNGGRYVINGNKHQIAFRDAKQVFKISESVSDYDVMKVCDSFIGVYSTEEEYDNACINELKSRGWI